MTTESKPSFLAAHGKRLSQAVAGATALVGLLVGITTLVDWGGKVTADPPPPAEIDATLDVALQARHEPLGTYLSDTNQSTEGLTRRELREQGLVFLINVRFKGSTKRTFPATWSLYDHRRDARLPGDTYTQPIGDFKPQGPNHAREWPQWIPYPRRPGTYRLHVTLKDDEGHPVATRDSRPFRVKSVPAI
jgi:hypothetical protein